jgi:hypothetical protein
LFNAIGHGNAVEVLLMVSTGLWDDESTK